MWNNRTIPVPMTIKKAKNRPFRIHNGRFLLNTTEDNVLDVAVAVASSAIADVVAAAVVVVLGDNATNPS